MILWLVVLVNKSAEVFIFKGYDFPLNKANVLELNEMAKFNLNNFFLNYKNISFG